MEQEKTLVLIKPDGVQRGLIGEIITRFERKGLKLIGLKLLTLPKGKAEELYSPHHGKFFYDYLVQFMTSDPIVALAVEGNNAIELVRLINGATKPLESAPGSIRGDFSIDITHNVVHASDSPENAGTRTGYPIWTKARSSSIGELTKQFFVGLTCRICLTIGGEVILGCLCRIFYRRIGCRTGISIALTIRSFNLFTRLIL